MTAYAADLGEWTALLDKMSRVPLDAIAKLEEVANEMFERTQAEVHVVTGSLRGSGKVKTDVHGTSWEMEIDYGGDSAGKAHDPVTYAETERARGGEHDFLASLPALEPKILEAMTSWL